MLLDETGRTWDIVPYRGDDVATRRAWKRAGSGSNPLLLVLTCPEGDHATLEASGIADLISLAEGSPIGLSTVGYFQSLFPRVNPPTPALIEHRHALLERIDEIVKASLRWKDRWGEPDTWTRGQFLAILLMARFPDWTLDDLWCDEESPGRLPPMPSVSSATRAWSRLTCRRSPRLSGNRPAMSGRVSPSPGYPSPPNDLDAFREEVAAFVVLRDLATSPASPHLDTLLRVKLPLTTFIPSVWSSPAADHRRDQGLCPLDRPARRAEPFLMHVCYQRSPTFCLRGPRPWPGFSNPSPPLKPSALS